MSQETSLILAAIIGGFAIVFFFTKRELNRIREQTKPDPTLVEWVKSSQEAMRESTKTLNERLDNAARVISGVQRSVGEMSEIGRSMRDLQEFLRSPKLRGNVGEQVLKELLGQMLPRQSFHLQYTFKSGVTVDAAVKTSAGIIPIDSKFPMENFRKMTKATDEKERKEAEREFLADVKHHIDDISKKYILTEEGTIDYALMYIPSEAVYYEIMTADSDLVEYAYQKRVLPVSPTTFYAYLRAILMSFEGQKIDARAREILSAIRAIQKDYNKVEDNLGVLGRHVTNSYNMMSAVVSSFTQLGQKITSTQALGQATKKEVEQLEVGDGQA